MWAIVQRGNSKAFYCVGEAIGGGSEVWLLPKSAVKTVTYHVPIVLNPPETLKPPTVKAASPNTYLAKYSIVLVLVEKIEYSAYTSRRS